MKNKNQLKNKYVLVTGASSGIGFQIAKDFLLEGAFVGVHYCNNLKGAKRALKYAKNKQCKIFKSDFSSSKEISDLWNEFILWSKGRIDVLVNNASFIKYVPLENLSEEEWDKTFQVNLKAPFLLSRAAFPIMSKKKNGRIINISSPHHKKIGRNRNDLSARVNLVPLKRLAEPSEISNAVLLLASSKSSFITNTIISVAGGE